MRALFLIFVTLLAHGADQLVPVKDCERALTTNAGHDRAKFEVISSDRVPGDSNKYKEYVKELTEPGGVLDKLGIRMTGQIVEFLQGRDLNALTSGTSGGYPVRFYLDGAQVIRALQPKGSFALEVVYPGPDYQHGFYRDDNPEAQQKSIIDHVVGHNNFAFTSVFPHYRAAQGLLASRRMDDLLRDIYGSYNKDEVQRFYLWSMTMAQMVDWYTPLYQDSKEFEPKLDVTSWDPLGRIKPKIQRHPKSPTENLLPAFAANIAPHQPPWKREMLELFAKAGAFRPALVHTQIMNEGWASIMQEIIPSHTKDNHSFTFWLQASRVMQAESSPKLSDPYSLGVFCWRRLRERFEKRPEIEALTTQLAKDHAFIQYADDEIIGRMDDSQFLRLAMDQTLIDRHKLAIVRKAQDQEQDWNLPPPNPPPKDPIAQWIVVSRDAEKVTSSIIDSVLKPKYMFHPRAKLMDFNRPGSGEVELVINDEVGRALALKKESAAPALYAMSNIIDKPVSLECYMTAAGTNLNQLPPQRRMFWGPFQKPEIPPLVRVRVVVSPGADVHVYRIKEAASADSSSEVPAALSEELDKGLTEELSTFFREYISDLYLEDDHELERIVQGSQTLRGLSPSMIAGGIENSPYDSLIQHAPNAAGAIMEFQSMMDRRMLKAMARAAKSSRGIRTFGSTMRVKALPSAMYLEFDRQYMQLVLDNKPGGQVDAHKTFNRNNTDSLDHFASPFGEHQGDEGQVVPISGNPGDHFWGPDKPQGDGSRGDGSQGNEPGEDPNDPSWVDIPPDLYAKFLGERVKLPNLNQKPGQSRAKKFKAGRRIRRMWGQMLPNEIAENAFKRGFGQGLIEGRDPLEDVLQTFDDGFDNLQPRDWVVKDKVIARKPDTKAVVTFVLDASGSTARYYEAFKRFTNDIETLIAANYKGFAFRYIIFDTQAHVMKNKNDFFRFQLGGGTNYQTGILRAKKLYDDEYPRAAWDRFTFLMGDMEDFAPDEAWRHIKNLLDESEFFGTVAGLNAGGDSPWLKLLHTIRGQLQDNTQLGLTILDPDGGYRIEHIREVLRNDDEQQ